ncbi:MAG: glycogen-debranching protein [Verrucomicrobia bacterium]|nr:glycogen-debranching protein [Verrucomicrobiota bacterium]
MKINIRSSEGNPSPLGLSIQGTSCNFAVFSSHATQGYIGLFSSENGSPDQEFPLFRTGDIWHIALEGIPPGYTYAFRMDPTRWLADPYAKAIASPSHWGTPLKSPAVHAPITVPSPFDWQGVAAPQILDEDLVIYEAHVRGFTRASNISSPGTYKGLIEKIPYLKKLGINAIELMPIFEFDETHSKNPPLLNYWGYNPLHFFTPMKRFAATQDPISEFKTLVRELHRNGILVILDVVYNHTGEGKERDYCVHFRGLDDSVYYEVLSSGKYIDVTGCGHTVNANHPQVKTFILDSLRYWAQEMHVDGFRFDLGGALTRGPDGKTLPNPPLIQAISKDPLLSKKKLIAEVWDAAGLYLLGDFPKWGPWHEWNGKYRDQVRRFIKGTDNYAGVFAASLCGSEPIYAAHSPLCSINFITAHDGYTLRDLVSYQDKHNMANGEQNKDGNDQNDSWNCGAEGATTSPQILSLREKQMRNFLLALFLSQGIPMLVMGDEYGHTRKGNNNPYVQDNEISWYLWNRADPKIIAFTSSLINFRKNNPHFRKTKFLTDGDVTWHGHAPHTPDWSPSSRFVACTQQNHYLAFNADYKEAHIELPPGAWHTLIDTSLAWDEQPLITQNKISCPAKFTMQPYSAILLEQ